jgi:hypothetical protein
LTDNFDIKAKFIRGFSDKTRLQILECIKDKESAPAQLHVPHLRSELTVERPAINKMLNEGLKNKLTVVTAPGGVQ